MGVHLFFLISFWFLYDKKINKISFENVKKLTLETIVIYFVCAVGTYLLGMSQTSVIRMGISAILSPINSSYWFISTYLIIYLIFPFINLVFHKVNLRNCYYLFGVLWLFGVMLKFIITYWTGGNMPNGSIMLALSDYCIVAILKKGGWNKKLNTVCVMGVVFLTIAFLGCVSFVGTNWIKGISNHLYDFVNLYSPITQIIGVMVFIIVVYQKERRFQSAAISSMGKYTIAVYLFHENPILTKWIWDDLFKINIFFYKSWYIYILHMVAVVLCLFILGMFIGFIYDELYKMINNRRIGLVQRMSNKLEQLSNIRIW